MSGWCEIGSDNRVLGRVSALGAEALDSARCPLVKSRHNALEFQCLLYPRKQTFSRASDKSVLGQKRISAKISCANRKTAAGRSRWSNAFPQCQGTAISLKIA